MEHTNLFLYETEADFLVDYPDGKVNEPVPAAVYIRGEEGELGTMHTNNEITTYTITIHSQNKTGETVAPDKTMQTPPVLDGNTVKVNIVVEPVEGYKPRHEVEKATFSGNGDFTIIYLGLVDYTVTVHHMFDGTPIAADTDVVVEDVWDESSVRVPIEPVSIAGYKAEPVTITVSGSCEYNLEYEKNAYEAIDLGLPSGTKWANMNVGSNSPEEYGNYYAWGEIKPNKASAYTLDNYKWLDSSTSGMSKYNKEDGKMTLDLEDDAAHVVMGGNWHIPSSAQCAEFLDNTTSSWTNDYNGTGVAGMVFTSKANGNSIFFPAAGGIFDEGSDGQREFFQVWAASRDDDSFGAYRMGAMSDSCILGGTHRVNGISVRGVLGELNNSGGGGGLLEY